MEQELELAAYDPAVIEFSDEVFCGTEMAQCDRNEKFVRRMAFLLLFQFLAAPIVLLGRNLIPPTIGFGQFSVAVDFHYLTAAAIGANAALIVLIPLVLAWSTRSAIWRLVTCVPLLMLASGITVACLLVNMRLNVFAPWRAFPFWQIMELVGIAFVFGVGLAAAPLAMRAYRGWHVSRAESPELISRWESWLEWAILVVALLVVFFSTPFFDRGAEIGALAAVIAVFMGVVVAAVALSLMREQSKKVLWLVIAIYLFAFVFSPCVGVWLSGKAFLPSLPAGSGIWFAGFAAGALVLLLHAMLFRGAGFRLVRGSFEQVKKATPKTVVDPFSD